MVVRPESFFNNFPGCEAVFDLQGVLIITNVHALYILLGLMVVTGVGALGVYFISSGLMLFELSKQTRKMSTTNFNHQRKIVVDTTIQIVIKSIFISTWPFWIVISYFVSPQLDTRTTMELSIVSYSSSSSLSADFVECTASSYPSFAEPNENCKICFQEGHGYHFGVFTCRACAAFFRRCHFSPIIGQRKCRMLNGKCVPNKNGRWFCKTCRFLKCLESGMTTTNIQYDRDAFKSSADFRKKQAQLKLVGDRIGVPITVETVLGLNHLISFIPIFEGNNNLPYIDISQLVDKSIALILNPNMVQKSRKLSNLEQLSRGLEDYQLVQKENITEIVHLTKEDHFNEFERSMSGAAKWLSCSDKFRSCSDEFKIHLLQSIWFIWGRLERIIMTAKMRSRHLCGKKQFVFSHESLIDYDRMDSDISCWSTHSFEEMKFFFIPSELYYDDVIWELMEVQPDAVELSFIMCMICFQLAGKHYGGHIQEPMEEMEDMLSNELHEYYMKQKKPMYLLRLKQLMKVKEKFLKIRNIRTEKYEVGGLFDMFNISISNPDFFWVPP
ncbi:hypothetical protein B9Z55_018463 [Caenorhabditis nigoni]|uniref:Nuclear receptor domain-containing protein n=1 Tax=Caenorhabditis nigoni TaxID=1611254 RepID=A0A2G5TEU2_9PELO|nr:hypothetical protein B9Z55_018463 [Caenorhabditis nigoni]